MTSAEKIAKLREKFAQVKLASEIDLQQIPASTRPGWESRKRQATEEMPKISLELATAVIENSVAMLLSSDVPNQSAFIEFVSSQEPNTIVVDKNGLSEFFFANVFRENRGDAYSFNSEAAAKINNLLYDVGIQLGLVSIDMVMIPATLSGTVRGKEAAVKRFNDIFTNTYGSSFHLAYLLAQIKQLALSKLNTDRFAILVTNSDEETAAALSPTISRLVTVSSENGSGKAKISDDMDPAAALKTVIGKLPKKSKLTQNDK
jgi:hypothetical protein